MIPICQATTNAEADLIKSILEDHGISCFIQGYHHRSLLGFVGSYIDLNILVPEKDQQQARQLIEELQATGETPLSEEPLPEPPLKEPAQKRPSLAFLLAYFLPGLGSLYMGRRALGGWLLMGALISWTVILFEMAAELDVYLRYAAAALIGFILLDMVSVGIYLRRKGAK